jgi:hypothetical protein
MIIHFGSELYQYVADGSDRPVVDFDIRLFAEANNGILFL